MIKINEDYSIESDADCVTIYRHTIIKSGKNKGMRAAPKPIKYFPNIEKAYLALIDLDVQSDGMIKIEYLVDKIKALKAAVSAAIRLTKSNG